MGQTTSSVHSLNEPKNELVPTSSAHSLDKLKKELVRMGFESAKLIVGIDFTQSNQNTGLCSFGGKCLHTVGAEANPYQQVINVIGRTLASSEGHDPIPCYGFGDVSTLDNGVFSFCAGDEPCQGIQDVLKRYKELVPRIKLFGPTSFAPVIYKAINIVKGSKQQHCWTTGRSKHQEQLHVLLLIADGQLGKENCPQEQATIKALEAASHYPLSIIMVGVGDGPWDLMKVFDDRLPQRAFNNFQFVNFSDIMRRQHRTQEQREAAFAAEALEEVPDQIKAMHRLHLFGHDHYKDFALYDVRVLDPPSRAEGYSLPHTPSSSPILSQSPTPPNPNRHPTQTPDLDEVVRVLEGLPPRSHPIHVHNSPSPPSSRETTPPTRVSRAQFPPGPIPIQPHNQSSHLQNQGYNHRQNVQSTAFQGRAATPPADIPPGRFSDAEAIHGAVPPARLAGLATRGTSPPPLQRSPPSASPPRPLPPPPGNFAIPSAGAPDKPAAAENPRILKADVPSLDSWWRDGAVGYASFDCDLEPSAPPLPPSALQFPLFTPYAPPLHPNVPPAPFNGPSVSDPPPWLTQPQHNLPPPPSPHLHNLPSAPPAPQHNLPPPPPAHQHNLLSAPPAPQHNLPAAPPAHQHNLTAPRPAPQDNLPPPPAHQHKLPPPPAWAFHQPNTPLTFKDVSAQWDREQTASAAATAGQPPFPTTGLKRPVPITSEPAGAAEPATVLPFQPLSAGLWGLKRPPLTGDTAGTTADLAAVHPGQPPAVVGGLKRPQPVGEMNGTAAPWPLPPQRPPSTETGRTHSPVNSQMSWPTEPAPRRPPSAETGRAPSPPNGQMSQSPGSPPSQPSPATGTTEEMLFNCPITQEVMVNPVLAADGHNYEEEAIRQWLQNHNTSPLTNAPMAHKVLTPNLDLRSAILEARAQGKI